MSYLDELKSRFEWTGTTGAREAMLERACSEVDSLRVEAEKREKVIADYRADVLEKIGGLETALTDARRERDDWKACAQRTDAKMLHEQADHNKTIDGPLAEARKERDAFAKQAKSATSNVRMALNALEELEGPAINRKRKNVPNFNEDAEWKSQVSAARVALDFALESLSTSDLSALSLIDAKELAALKEDRERLGWLAGHFDSQATEQELFTVVLRNPDGSFRAAIDEARRRG